MGIIKSVLGFGGIERIGERVLKEVDLAQARGETQVWVKYSQNEVGMSNNATKMAVLIRRRIEKAGHEVLDGEGGDYGDDVRLLVRIGRR